MSSPFPIREQDGMQLMPSSPAADGDINGVHNISRRIMQVKVLYTFDDQNKSNCLARLPGPMNIPTVAVDETTEVGVIELRACIRAIVAASPELVAKLGHDYTVYAYDFSEYETPLVGQGMLSWILASASTTPNAPADQSETMVTGRVCKNILGLFTNGIKETLEVKLKLIPVPTCLQREYVENMERYHSLSQIMPEGLEYSAWAEFLRTNPTIAQLTQPGSQQFLQSGQRESMGRTHTPSQEPMHRVESKHPQQPHMAYNSYGTRPSSPALSTVSFSHYQHSQDTRPVSRASCRSESIAPSQNYHSTPRPVQDQQEEGPPKKRARVTKAARPKKTPLVATTESLRVAASTAASVRLHRPAITPSASDMASMEQVPRAPTPRPSGRSLAQPAGRPRGTAPSLLRHASMDEGRSFPSPYDSAMFSDNAVDSADDERGNSPGETPMDIPSSPPVMPQRIASSAPSSPGLPSLPYPPDSGFVSDMTLARDNDGTKVQAWEGSDLPTASDTRTRRKQDRSQSPWTVVTPGPVELLPKSYIPKPRTYPRPRASIEKMEKGCKNAPPPTGTELSDVAEIPDHLIDPQLSTLDNQSGNYHGEKPVRVDVLNQERMQPTATSMYSAESPNQNQQQPTCQGFQHPAVSSDARLNNRGIDKVGAPINNDVPAPPLRASTPNAGAKPAKTSHSRGLPRSQTWSGEPMSDAALPEAGSRQPRSGSGAKRKQLIADQLVESLAKGVMPAYCNHCGEIETPTWRKAYTRVERGLPIDIHLSSDGNGIVAYDVIEPSEEDQYTPKYRIFKQALDKTEKDGGTFQQLNLCNPCGLWLNKKNAMRPAELWGPKKPIGEKPKRKRNPPKGPRKKGKGLNDEIHSDAIVPNSEPIMPTSDAKPQNGNEESRDRYLQQSTRYRSCSSQLPDQPNFQLDNTTAMVALERAIQSSPGCAGSKESPINVEPELTPKPTRRLLFPSPRRVGGKKSLADSASSVSPTAKSPSRKLAAPAVQIFNHKDMDKENCPPSASHDDLAHLFEDQPTPKTTPRKDAVMQELLKTPTPASRRRTPLGSKRGTDMNAEAGLTTPSRNNLTPSRSGRAATIAPETPFTRQLNAMLSDCLSSPSQAIDFSAFSPFSLTPGRNGATFADYNLPNDFLSSDLPIPSSPSGPGFALFEDPATSTVGLWSGASIFEGSDAIGVDGQQQQQQGEGPDQNVLSLKTTAISVDFAAMIDGAMGGGHDKENVNGGLERGGGSGTTKKENQSPAVQDKIVAASAEKATETHTEAA